MKLKKFLAASTAALLALSSVAVSSVTVMAVDTVAADGEAAATTSTYDIFKFEAGVIASWSNNIQISADKFSAAAEGQNLVIVCSPLDDATNAQLAVKNPTGNWPAVDGTNDTYAISAADTSKTIALSATAVTDAKANGIALSGQQIVVKTVKLGDDIIYDSSSLKGEDASVQYGVTYFALADQVEDWGITADNLADCTMTVTFGEAATNTTQLSVGPRKNFGDYYGVDYTEGIQIAWMGNGAITGTSVEIPLSAASETAVADVVANGLAINIQNAWVTGISITVPAAEGGEEEPGDDETGDVVNIVLTNNVVTGQSDMTKPNTEIGAVPNTANSVTVPLGSLDGSAVKKIVAELECDSSGFNGAIGANKYNTETWYASDSLTTSPWVWEPTDGVDDSVQVQVYWINVIDNDGEKAPGSVTVTKVTLYGEGDTVLAIAEPESAEDPTPPGDNDSSIIEIPFDKSHDITLTVVDASWGAEYGFTKAAQVNIPVTVAGITPKTTTYGDIKAKRINLTGIDWAAFNLPNGIEAENITTVPYIKFGADSGTWRAASSPVWDLSTITGVTDATVVGEIGYQININGNYGGIEDMDAELRDENWEVTQEGATLVLPLKTGGSGSTTPGDDTPGTTTPGSTPGYPGAIGGAPSSTPSTPSDENKNDVKFENSDTKIEISAPEGAFDNAADVTFNAAPVADETKDGMYTFDLSFTDKDGNKVQPKVAVTVKIPVPEALKGKTVYVYHVEDNGTYTEINCKVEGGMIVFSASSFSKYVVSETKLSANGTPVSGDSDSSNNPGGNPNTGVAALSLLPIAGAIAGIVIFKKRK